MNSDLGSRSVRSSEGSILKTLFLLAWPILLANMLQTSYLMVNLFWLGCLSTRAVAAVAASSPIIALLTALCSGLQTACFILVTQYAGAREQQLVNRVAAQALLVMVVMALTFSAVGYVSAAQLLRLMGIGPDIIDETARYLRISLIGGSFVFAVTLSGAIMRGVRRVRLVLYVTTFSVVLNMALDPLFIFGAGPIPHGGVAGAACATLLAQATTAAVAFYLLSDGRYNVRLQARNFVPDFVLLKRMLLLGYPASLQNSLDPVALMIFTTIVASFGTIAIAANGVALRIFTFFVILASSMTTATGIMVGGAMGAGDSARAAAIAIRSAWTLFAISTLLGILVYMFATPLMRLFMPPDALTIDQAARAVQAIALCFGVVGAWLSMANTFSSSGDTMFPMIMNVIAVWAVEIPVAWVLARHTSLGTLGLWLSYPASGFTVALGAVLWFRTGRWKRTDITGAATLRTALIEP